ncbi:hypothetical protein GCM10009102_20330 [Sphingomonas insulae]|uniref:Uncharacterized protein n=1 Tax=Sphingomonas insulae TaxID=424800 RepID=A0ABN1HVN5_9SPHN
MQGLRRRRRGGAEQQGGGKGQAHRGSTKKMVAAMLSAVATGRKRNGDVAPAVQPAEE